MTTSNVIQDKIDDIGHSCQVVFDPIIPRPYPATPLQDHLALFYLVCYKKTRGKNRMAIILKESATALTAIVEPSEGKYVIACPELDLATEGDTPEAAFEDLVDMALDYAAQYMEEYDLFSMSPNRAAHAPFVKVVHEMGSREKVKALFA